MDELDRAVDLVRQAIHSGLSNCLGWINDRTASRVRNDPANRGLTPDGIRELVIEHVRDGGVIEGRREEREPWKDRREWWFYVIIPLADFPRGLFVEMELTDDDADVPVVSLVNAHPQVK